MRLEAKIGLFVVMGLTALFLLSTQVTKLGKWDQESYVVYAYIDDANGLEKQSKVSMNGVTIGEVAEISIEGRRVKLMLSIKMMVEIPEDSTLLVIQESVLGAKMIDLLAGEAEKDLPEGGTIEHFKQYASFDKTSDSVNAAARQLELLMHDLRDVLGEQQKTEIQEMISAFKNVGVSLDSMIVENRMALKSAIDNFDRMGASFTKTADIINSDLPQIMARIDSLTKRLDGISGDMQQTLPQAVEKFIVIEDNLTAMITENRSSLSEALTSAGGFFGKGEAAFDKVDSMLSNFTVSELQVSFRGDYMSSDEYMRIDLGIVYLPNPETYYMLDLVSMDDYSQFDVNGDPTGPGRHDESNLLVSAQYGKRFDDILLRGGIIESTGGVGMDYFADHDRLLVSYDLFDFGAHNDVRGDEVHMRLGVRYRMLKHFELYGGWDNFLNSEADNIYFGIGFRFIDNNLKYVLGTSAAAL